MTRPTCPCSPSTRNSGSPRGAVGTRERPFGLLPAVWQVDAAVRAGAVRDEDAALDGVPGMPHGGRQRRGRPGPGGELRAVLELRRAALGPLEVVLQLREGAPPTIVIVTWTPGRAASTANSSEKLATPSQPSLRSTSAVTRPSRTNFLAAAMLSLSRRWSRSTQRKRTCTGPANGPGRWMRARSASAQTISDHVRFITE